jgi:hypothetical protein
MGPARVNEYRTARDPHRKLGNVDHEIPVLFEQARTSGVDQFGQPRRRCHKGIPNGNDLPIHVRVALAQLIGHVNRELLHRLIVENRRDDESQLEGRRPLFGNLRGTYGDITPLGLRGQRPNATTYMAEAFRQAEKLDVIAFTAGAR